VKILVLTISDRASQGEYEDLSGPAVVEILKLSFPETYIKIKALCDLSWVKSLYETKN